MTYPCHVCASTMLPGVTYTIPREYDPSQPSCGKVYYYYQGSAYPGMVSSPSLVDCGFCKGSGMVGERRMSRGPRRRKADRRAMLSQPEARSASGWIPVVDRVPRNTDHVLVAYLPAFHKSTKGHRRRTWSITVCRYSGGAWRFVIPSQKSRLSERVKFWQPIPDEPTLTPSPPLAREPG